MPDIHAMDTLGRVDLRNVDLNLLVTLDALLEHRSVGRAAEQVDRSQPAVSAQLARLRRHFADELLARSGNRYRLTPLAVRLRGPVRAAVDGADRVFTARPEFAPGTSTREFCLAMSDYGTAVFGPGLAAALAREAPAARLRFVANTPALVDDAAQALTGIDLLVMPHGFLDGLPHHDLHRDEWVCLVAADNPDVGAELGTEQLAAMPWVVTYHGPTASTPAVRQMRMLGIEPQVQVITESFLTVPGLVAGTGRVALLQRRLAQRVPAEMPVRVLPCPFAAGPLVEAAWWHPVHQEDPAHRYLRELLVRTAAEAPG